MAEGKQSKGRLRRWLDKRRDAQRRGAEMAGRAKASRRRDSRAPAATATWDPAIRDHSAGDSP